MKIEKKSIKIWYKNILKKSKYDFSKTREQLYNLVDIPDYITSDSSKITIIDNTSVLIEGYVSVIDYYKHYIKIKGYKVDIAIDGKDLNISEITKEDLVISGDILNITFGGINEFNREN
ncbi:MAG: YabP/YqfC family sporulation protein [Clostridia bacterium]